MIKATANASRPSRAVVLRSVPRRSCPKFDSHELVRSMVQRIASGTVLGRPRAAPRARLGRAPRRGRRSDHKCRAPGLRRSRGQGAVSRCRRAGRGAQRRPRWVPAASGRGGWCRRRPSRPDLGPVAQQRPLPARLASVNRAFVRSVAAAWRLVHRRVHRRVGQVHAHDAVIALEGLGHHTVKDPVGVPVVVAGAKRGLAALAQTARHIPRTARHQREHNRLEHVTIGNPSPVAPQRMAHLLTLRKLRLQPSPQRIHHPRRGNPTYLRALQGDHGRLSASGPECRCPHLPQC